VFLRRASHGGLEELRNTATEQRKPKLVFCLTIESFDVELAGSRRVAVKVAFPHQ